MDDLRKLSHVFNESHYLLCITYLTYYMNEHNIYLYPRAPTTSRPLPPQYTPLNKDLPGKCWCKMISAFIVNSYAQLTAGIQPLHRDYYLIFCFISPYLSILSIPFLFFILFDSFIFIHFIYYISIFYPFHSLLFIFLIYSNYRF